MLYLEVTGNYINGFQTALVSEEGKMLVFANTKEAKDGIIEVIDKFIESCPDFRKEALEAMYVESEQMTKGLTYLGEKPGIFIPCEDENAVKTLVDTLYSNKILTDETFKCIQCIEHPSENLLNK
jgi:hypothetical protein